MVSEEEAQQLKRVVKRHTNWRMRERAATTVKPMTIILDNATIHHAKGIAHVVRMLQKQGITLYFLPPYSPELNRIEKLWHRSFCVMQTNSV